MKKSITIISSLAIAAAAFVGCQQIEENVPSGNAVTLNFAAETVDPASTKATLTPNEGETAFAAAWEKDTDAIGIYALVGEDYTENVEGIYNGSAFSANIKGTVGEDAIFSAAYPYSADGVIEFGQARKQNGSIYNSAYDVMFADGVIGTLAQDATISLPMYRQSAIAYFHFTGDLSESETVQSATLTVTGKGENDLIAGGYMYDDSGIEPVGEAGSITISFENGTSPSVNDFTLWFNVIPVEYTALKLEVETENYTLTVNNSTAGTYVAGKLYKVSADASAKWLGKTKNVASFSINGVIDENNNKEFAGNEIITFPEVVAPEGKTFVGWSTEAITRTQATAPTTMVTPGEERMGLENATYYAVFATESGSTDPVLDQTLQYDTWTYNGSTTDKTSYRLFHSGSYIESAAFDLSTLSKVIVYGGTFGGTSYNSLTIGDGTNTWKSVTVSGSSQTGKNEYTGGTALSGTGKLRITSNSGTATSTGVRISKIEIFVQGEISYSEYCTTVATLSSISVKTTPTKVTYTEGEKFNPSGLVITRNYSDNTSDDYAYAGHESEFSFDPSTDTELTTSITSVTITYKSMTVDQAITVNEITALSTIDEVFAAATQAGKTATDTRIAFNNWVVSGIKQNESSANVYVTDGTKGFIVYGAAPGFAVGDIISGTAYCKVQLYNGAAELTELTSSTEGITVTKGGTITPVQTTIANLSGVNTGAVIDLGQLTYNGTQFTDDENNITPYNTFISLPTFTSGKKYNVSGIFIIYNTVKEIAPRTGEDITEVPAEKYGITINVNNTAYGSVTTNAVDNQAVEGQEVTLTVSPAEGYKLASLTVVDAASQTVTVNNNKFIMPAKAVTVSATFEEIPSNTITYINGDHGTVSGPASALEGSEVTLNVTTDTGYSLATLTVVDSDNNPVTVKDNKFTMPNAAVTVSATFSQATTRYYELVTTAPEDWTIGKYLIVYSTKSVALTGSENTAQTIKSPTSVTITSNKIVATSAIDAISVTFEANSMSGYLIKTASGSYVYNTSSKSNGFSATTDASTAERYAVTLGIDDSANAIITAAGSYLRWNDNATNGQIFNFYKATSYTAQQAIQLYRLTN